MHLLGLHCPHCGKTKAYHWIPSSRYAPVAPIAFGGVVLATIFAQSRKQQFRCELCSTTFSSHTIGSRFFQIFWVFFIFWAVVALLALVAILILH
jgi:NADH:ubiquinone oxidoreductase subunit 6 (subunit J)